MNEESRPLELPSELEERMEDLPPEAKNIVREVIQTESYRETIRSPLPPPALLKQYEEILPGATDRFLTSFENQAKHRQKQEIKLLDAEIADQKADRSERKRGQWLGFGIGSIAIITGDIVAGIGQPWSGTFLGCSGVASLVSVFVIGRRAQYQQFESESGEEEEIR